MSKDVQKRLLLPIAKADIPAHYLVSEAHEDGWDERKKLGKVGKGQEEYE